MRSVAVTSKPLTQLLSRMENSFCSSESQSLWGTPCWPLYLELFGEVVSHNGGEGGEEGSQEHADVTDVDGDVEEVQHVVNRC